ncbi:MAG: gliding motility-associated C-terminal domain-containing protein [Chitinophagaceae bacterium]
MRKKTLLIGFFFFLLQISSYSQKDTEFWFSAPDIHSLFERPILLRIASFNNPAVIAISIPANASFVPLSVSLPANSSTTVDLTAWITLIENSPANTVLNKGLYIRASSEITAYYEIVSANADCSSCSPELFSLKGKNALGLEFIIPSQTTWGLDTIRYSTARASFDIVATEDNTIINIIPKKPLIGRTANVPFSITLNKGQTFSNQGLYRNKTNLLNGSTVTASKLISVTTREDLLFADGPCADLAGDQLIPVSIFGNDFVVIRGGLFNRDRIVVSAAFDNTNIYLDGNSSPAATINKGASYEFDLISQPTSYIHTDNKISVFHYTGMNCEISSAVIPKINCTGSTDVSIVKSSSETAILMIVTKSGNQAGFTINGNPGILTAADFSPVIGTSGNYVFCKKDMGGSMPLNAATRIINSIGRFQLGFLNGASSTLQTGCRYGYFSDFKSSNVQESLADVCKKDSVQLNAFGGVSYQWLPVNGVSSPTIPDPKVSPDITTNYTVIITDNEGCIDSAKVIVTVKDKPVATISGNTVCSGQPGQLMLQATEGAGPFNITYANASSNYSMNNVTNNSIFHTDPNLTTTTTYTLLSIEDINGCVTVPIINNTGNVTVNALPLVGLTDDASICEGKDIALLASGGTSYSWSPSSGLSAVTVADPLANPLVTTKYYVSVTDANMCTAKDSVLISVIPKPAVDAGSEMSVCKNIPFQLNGSGNGNYNWQPANFVTNNLALTTNATIPATTTFYLTVENNFGCKATDSVKIDVRPDAIFTLSPIDTTICKGNSLTLLATGGNIYTWGPGTGLSSLTIPNPTVVINAETIFSVQVTETTCGESATLSSIVRVRDLPIVSSTKSNDIDCSFQFAQLAASGAQKYDWTPVTGLNNALSQNPIAEPLVTTDYIVKGTDNKGCIAFDTITVNVSATGNLETFIPTAFTPNNDGKNDCVGVRNLSVNKGFELSIFNRWGQRLFFTQNSGDCWDGRYKGEVQPSAVYIYFYKLNTACGNIFKKGTITLIK